MTLLPGWTFCAMTSTDYAEKTVKKCTVTTTVGVQKIVAKCAATTTDDEKIVTNTTKCAVTPTNKVNEAKTKKRLKTSRAELRTKGTIKTNAKKTGGVPQAEIKTATIDTKGAKTSQTRVNTTATNRNNDNTGRIIVTTSYAATHGIRADVLVRASGTDSPLRVKGFPAPDIDKGREPLLIDFDDSCQFLATEDTRRRLHDYRRRGMTVVAAEVAQQDNEASERKSSGGRSSGTSGVGLVAKPAQQSGLKTPAPSRSARGRK